MKRFAIPSLALAGLVGFNDAAAAPSPIVDAPDQDEASSEPPLILLFDAQRALQFAQHRSHQSHQSHGSHRSSSGGARPRATPLYTPPPPPPPTAPRASSESAASPPSTVLPSESSAPNSDETTYVETLRRVQQILYAYGFYNGEIDGVYGPMTSAAISRFQADRQIPVTGTITPEVLDALGLPAP